MPNNPMSDDTAAFHTPVLPYACVSLKFQIKLHEQAGRKKRIQHLLPHIPATA